MLHSALFRKFEVMGQAASKVSAPFREAHAETPGKRIITYRHVLMHVYDRTLIVGLLKALEELPEVEDRSNAAAV